MPQLPSLPAPPAEPSRQIQRLLLLAIVVLAAALRLPTLGAQSLWYDEAATWFQVSGTPGQLLYRTAADNYPPLYNILVWLLIRVLGDSEWVLRLPAALLGIANVPLIYLLGRRMAGPTAGLIAALLLALSGFHLWYSQEARMYTLLAFAATAYGWAAVRTIEDGGSWRNAALMAIAGAALVYSHPYGALTFIGIGIGALLTLALRRDWNGLRWLVGAGLATCIAFLPWALILLGRAGVIEETGFWIEMPTPQSVWSDLVQLTGGTIYVLLLAAPLLLVLRRRLVPLRLSFAPLLLACWIAAPMALGLAASLLFEPIFIERYLIGLLPAFQLLIAIAVVALARTTALRIAGAALAALIGLMTLFLDTPADRDDWRSAVAEARSRYRDGDCIAIRSDYQRVAVDYYWRDPNRCTLPGDASAEGVADLKLQGRLYLFANIDRSVAEQTADEIAEVVPLDETHDHDGVTVFVFSAE